MKSKSAFHAFGWMVLAIGAIVIILLYIVTNYAHISANRFEDLVSAYSTEDILYRSDEVCVVRDSIEEYTQAYTAAYDLDYAEFVAAVREVYQLESDQELVPIYVVIRSMEKALGKDIALCHGGKLLMVVKDGKAQCFVAGSECGAFTIADANSWEVTDVMFAGPCILDSSRCSFSARVTMNVNILGKKIVANEPVQDGRTISVEQLTL